MRTSNARERAGVVFSTGIDGTGTNYEGLYRHWVEAGYAVAAPEFPLSKADATVAKVSSFKSQAFRQ